MYTDLELKLLGADTTRFPMLTAIKQRAKQCTSCGHGPVNIHSMLRAALNRYKSDKQFLEWCSTLFKLPCNIAGVTLEKPNGR